MNIRPANANDIEQLCLLHRQMYFEMAAMQPSVFSEAEPDKELILHQMSSDKHAFFVSTGSSNIITGFICVELTEFAAIGCAACRLASIQSYFVRRTERRSEVISHLVNAAYDWACRQKARQLSVSLLAQDGFGIGTFDGEGFETAFHVMSKKCRDAELSGGNIK